MTALRAVDVPDSTRPRVGVVPDAPSDLSGVLQAAHELGITLWPHQLYVLTVLYARRGGEWRYREVPDLEARRNGKTTKLLPLIVDRLRRGRKILHAAPENRELPRQTLFRLAEAFPSGEAKIRQANGQETVQHVSGGSYRITASQPKSIRGFDGDDLIIDEIREMRDFAFMAAAEPVLASSADPQVIYLSNAGDSKSVVLNELMSRAEHDSDMGYLEWSADPELATDNREGWLQANPSIGYGHLTLERLQKLHDKYQRAGELSIFETEHLCRQVESMLPRLVQDVEWQQARRAVVSPVRPAMGISVDPGGARASACLSWAQGDGSIGLMLLADVTGNPLDVDAFAKDLQGAAHTAGVQTVGFDPATDKHLARYFPDAKPLSGQTFSNASERFVRDIETGKLRWQWADQVSEDLPYTARKPMGGAAFQAMRANAQRPITAVLAAIRAHWLASEPDPGPPNIY